MGRYTLGHQEDIEQAEKILKNSMSRVVGMIEPDEIKEALSLGIMSEAQAWELSSAKEQTKADQLTDKKTEVSFSPKIADLFLIELRASAY